MEYHAQVQFTSSQVDKMIGNGSFDVVYAKRFHCTKKIAQHFLLKAIKPYTQPYSNVDNMGPFDNTYTGDPG